MSTCVSHGLYSDQKVSIEGDPYKCRMLQVTSYKFRLFVRERIVVGTASDMMQGKQSDRFSIKFNWTVRRNMGNFYSNFGCKQARQELHVQEMYDVGCQQQYIRVVVIVKLHTTVDHLEK